MQLRADKLQNEASAAALLTLAGAVASTTPNFLARAFRFSSSEASAGRSVSAASVSAGSAAAVVAAVGASEPAAAPSAEAALHTMGFLACNSCKKQKNLVEEGCPIHKIRHVLWWSCLLCLMQVQRCLREQGQRWKHRLPVHLAPVELASVPPASLQALPSFQ